MGGLQELGGAPDRCCVRGRDHAQRHVEPPGEVTGELGTQGASAGQDRSAPSARAMARALGTVRTLRGRSTSTAARARVR